MGHALCLLQYLTSVFRQSKNVDSTPIDNIKEWGEKKQIKKTKLVFFLWQIWLCKRAYIV